MLKNKVKKGEVDIDVRKRWMRKIGNEGDVVFSDKDLRERGKAKLGGGVDM